MLINYKNEQFDIILQAGQSNSEGCGYGAVVNPFNPDERILYFNNGYSLKDSVLTIEKDYCINPAEEAIWNDEVWNNETICNFSLPFAECYVKNQLLKPTRKLLIVRAAVGGTGFLDGRWGFEAPLFMRMMAMTKAALSLNSGNRLVAFLWHQGESDAGLQASYKVHYENLISLIKAVKSSFKCENLPFIAADFVHDWKYSDPEITKMCEPVVTAIRDICDNLGNAAFVETDGLASNAEVNGGDDRIHFSRGALMELGKRYFERFAKIILTMAEKESIIVENS